MQIERTPYLVLHRETSAFKDVYGGAGEMVVVECMRIAPKDSSSHRAIALSDCGVGPCHHCSCGSTRCGRSGPSGLAGRIGHAGTRPNDTAGST